MPLLLLVGEKDERTTPQFIEHFAARHPTSRVQILPNADHFFRGQEAEVAEAVAQFFVGVRQSAVKRET